MTVFAPYANWMGKHKTGFFIVNIIIQWINKTVELFFYNAEYKRLTFLKISPELVIPREAIWR